MFEIRENYTYYGRNQTLYLLVSRPTEQTAVLIEAY
jgi:hypothetical protein